MWVTGIVALIGLAAIAAVIDRDQTTITKAEIPAFGHRDLLLENVHEGYQLSFTVVMKDRGPFTYAIIQPDSEILYENDTENREFSGTVAKISGPHMLRVSNPSSTEAVGYISFRVQPSSWMPIELMFLLFVTVTSLPVLISRLVYRQSKIQGRKMRGMLPIFIITLLFAIYQWVGIAWHYWFVEEISHAVLVNDLYDYISWSMATYALIVLLRQKRGESELAKI